MRKHQIFQNITSHKVSITLYLRRGEDTQNIVSIKTFSLKSGEVRKIELAQSGNVFINGVSLSFLKLEDGVTYEWSKKLLETKNEFDFFLNHSNGIAIHDLGDDGLLGLKACQEEIAINHL